MNCLWKFQLGRGLSLVIFLSVVIVLQEVLNALSRSDNKGISANVKHSAGFVVSFLREGKLLEPLAKSLPAILSKNPKDLKHQLVIVLTTLTLNSPPKIRGALDSLTKFLSSNLNGVNNLISSPVSGTPDILKGVVPALLGPLGALNETLLGTVDSIGEVLSGLLN